MLYKNASVWKKKCPVNVFEFFYKISAAFALAPRMYFTKDKLGIVCDVCKKFKGENLFCQG